MFYTVLYSFKFKNKNSKRVLQKRLILNAFFSLNALQPDTKETLPVIIMICLGSADSRPDNTLLQMLNTLFISENSPQEKCRILEKDFQIPMTITIESEVSTMCNFSEGFFERGVQKGLLEGETRGEARGKLHTLYDLTRSGIITLSTAAQQAGQTEEEFRAGLDAYKA